MQVSREPTFCAIRPGRSSQAWTFRRLAARNSKLRPAYPAKSAGSIASGCMNDQLDIRDLLVAICRMKEDRRTPSASKWYESQKEHWIGWLLDYQSPGAYDRKTHNQRDARCIYNRVVCPDLLLYLAKGSGVSASALRKARTAASLAGPTQMAKAGAVRRALPWAVVLEALRNSGLLPKNAA